MTSRDDFYKLDEYSFGLCMKILEDYEAACMDLNSFLNSIDDGAIKLETLDALEAMLNKFGKNHAVKLRLSILAQMRDKLKEAQS